MDMSIYSQRKNEELLLLEPVSLVIRKGRLGWFGHVEYQDVR